MNWLFFAGVFFLAVLGPFVLTGLFVFAPKFWLRNKKVLISGSAVAYLVYFCFVAFGTGPQNPVRDEAKYRLPWKSGVARFVAQGNFSFTSHRHLHAHAWDFVMPIGTAVLAAREGEVVRVVDFFDGIGWDSNSVEVRHEDGEISVYAHIQRGSAVVDVGDQVVAGQPLATVGMVGMTLFPHLHFVVLNPDRTASVPASFLDVEGGYPKPGWFVKSRPVPD